MRILIHGIDFLPEKVGIGKYTGEMAEWLVEHGHDVTVLTSPPHFPGWKIFEGYSSWKYKREKSPRQPHPGSLRVVRCPVWIPENPRGWRRVLYLLSFAICSSLPMCVQTFRRPDIVLTVEPSLVCVPFSLLVARLTGACSWLHIQDFEVDAAFTVGGLTSSKQRRLALMLEGLAMRRFDRVSTISESMLERVMDKGVNASKSVLFPNWVDTQAIHPIKGPNEIRRELGIPESGIVALYSGSMGAKHALDLVIEVSLLLTCRKDIFFVFCGDGPYREKILATRTSNTRVLPLQPIERLNELLNTADIHLLPQISGVSNMVMPSKLTGMMASGRAIIATAEVGTELHRVVEGRGVVTAPGDPKSFASALVQLADDPQLRERLGDSARQYAVRYMDRVKILSEFEYALVHAELPRALGDKPTRYPAMQNAETNCYPRVRAMEESLSQSESERQA